MNKERDLHTIPQWERAIRKRNNIIYNSITLENGYAVKVSGVYRNEDGREISIYWNAYGEAFHHGNRARFADIIWGK